MRIDISKERKLVHEMIAPIRWGDMDAYGHLNNTVYFRFMEQARVEWITSLGYQVALGQETMVMINGFCNFYKQVSYPGNLILKTSIGAIGRTSMDVFTSMALATAPDEEVAIGGATMVWADLATSTSAPWPEDILQKIR